MEKLPKFVVTRLAQRQQQAADHPETDVLTAFAEGSLSFRERTAVLEHLAHCPACRQVVALSSGNNDSAVNPVSSDTRRWAFSWRWRWAAAMAVACLVIAVVWRPEFSRNNQQHPPAPAPAAMEAPPMEILPPPPPAPLEIHKERAVAPKQALPPSRKPSPKTIARAESQEAKPAEMMSDAAPEMTPALQSAAPKLNLSLPEQARSFKVSPITPKRSLFAMRRGPEESLWRLPEGRGGTLERSQDGGKTWQSVPVSNGSQLYALSAAGPEIWVGGAEGVLFHSVDNGSHWTLVIVAEDGRRLRDAITRIDVREGKGVGLTVQGGGSWITFDGGEHWRPE
jgi:hypothetical protein